MAFLFLLLRRMGLFIRAIQFPFLPPIFLLFVVGCTRPCTPLSVMEAKQWSKKLDGLLAAEQLGLWIDNEYVPSHSGKTFDVIDPATEEILAQVALGGKADIDRAVDSAEGNRTVSVDKIRLYNLF